MTPEELSALKVKQYELELAKDPKCWELLSQLEDIYNNGSSEHYEGLVIESGECHYDDVDRMGELAFQLFLEDVI